MPRHRIVFWNLENLFAPEDHPDRPAWLARAIGRDLRGWTESLFTRKIEQLGEVLRRIDDGAGPDILAVCEVENRFVLELLAARLNEVLPERLYRPVHADSQRDQRGIDTAFLMDERRYGHDPASLFSYFVMRRTGTRDITQATFTTPAGIGLVLLCNHWPSRSGGTHESRGYRMTAGETLAWFHQRIRQELGDDTAILALGDFNDEPSDESLTLHALATRERGDVERARSVPRFYNLAWRYLQQEATDHRGDPRRLSGTLYFGGNGFVFDQILAAKGLLLPSSPLQVVEDSARIEADPILVDHRVSEGPIRFGLPRGDAERNVNPDGFSDHFPVSVLIEERG
jgi:hypothetical protein